jgi:hypothetical protein
MWRGAEQRLWCGSLHQKQCTRHANAGANEEEKATIETYEYEHVVEERSVRISKAVRN